MHKALLTTLGAAALALAVAPPALADTATSDLVLARDACGGTSPANTRLDFDPGAFTDSCGNLLAGVSAATTTYPAVSGALPLTIDPARPALIGIQVDTEGIGVGDEKLTVALTGKTTDGRVVTLGSATQTRPAAQMLTTRRYTADFELPMTGNGATYSSLALKVTIGGSFLSSFVNHGGGSYVSLPVPDPVPPPV